MGGRVEDGRVGRQRGLPPRRLRVLLGRIGGDAGVLPGGARGGGPGAAATAVEHVDVAQVEVLVLQDGAQLLEDVAARGLGCGGTSPGGGGHSVDAVVPFEVALLSDREENSARKRGERGLIRYSREWRPFRG